MAAALRRRLWQSSMFPNGSMTIVLRRLTSSMLAQRFDLGYCNRTSPIGRMTSLELFFFLCPGQLDRDLLAAALMPWPTGQGYYGRTSALANWTGILQLCFCTRQLDRDLPVVFTPWPTGQGCCSRAYALANWTGILRSYLCPGQLDRDMQGCCTRSSALANWTGILQQDLQERTYDMPTHGERETFCGDVRSVY